MAAIKTQLFIDATEKGFSEVTKSIQGLGESINKAMSAGTGTTSRLTQEVDKLRGAVNDLVTASNNLSQGFSKSKSTGEASIGVFKNMQWSISSVVSDMEKLIQIQLRWYGTRAILNTIAQGFKLLVTNTFEYVSALDQAQAEMLRFSATSGTVTKEAVQGVSEAVKAIRQALIERPVSMKDMSDMAQAFVGAGVAEKTVAAMIPDLANLKTAFHEIDMKQFAVAVTAAFNTFKDQIKGAYSDAEKFKVIIETLLRGQAVGIIRPEEFSKVMQYMSVVSKIGGFSLQQMTAMSVAITDTGNKAATAARLASSFMMALTQTKARAELERIGIQLDRGASLASQFGTIVKQILGMADISKGAVPLGVQQFLGGMMGREQMRAFLSFLISYEKFVKLTDELDPEKLGGALSKAADIMSRPVGAQWIILGNVVKALGAAFTTLNEGSLRNIVSTIVDVARGMLFAADSSGTFAGKMYLLGEAGKVTYDITKGIKDVVVSLLAALDPFITLAKGILSVVGEVVKAITSMREAMMLLSSVIAGILIAKGLALLLGSVATLFVSLGSLLPLFPALATGFLSLGVAAEAVGLMISRAFLPVAVAIAAMQLFFSVLNKGMDDSEKKALEWETRVRKTVENITTESEVQTALTLVRRRIKTHEEEKPKEPAKAEGITETYQGDLKEWKETKQSMLLEEAMYLTKLTKLRTDAKEKEKTDKGTGPPEETWKGYVEKTVTNIKKIYSARYDEIKSDAKTELSLLEEQHTYGLISTVDYENKRLSILETAKDKELIVINEEIKAIGEGYDKMVAELSHRAKMPKIEREAKTKELRESEAADIAKLIEKGYETEDKFIQEAANTRKKTWQERLKMTVDGYKAEEKLAEIHNQMMNDIEMNRLKMQKTINDFQYERGTISATKYYEKEKELMEENLQESLRSLAARKEARDKFLRQELQAVGGESVRGKQIVSELVIVEEDYQRDRVKLELDANEKILALRQKMAVDLKALFESKGGFLKVTEFSLQNVVNEFLNMGKQIDRAWTDVCKGLADTFETIFVDFTEGTLKSFNDYFNTFAKGILRTMQKILSEVIAGYIAMGVKVMIGPGSTSTTPTTPTSGAPPVPVYTTHQGGLILHQGGIVPEFHVGGLMHDERMAKVLTGERVMSREQNKMFTDIYQNTKKTGTDVTINLHNETGKEIKAEQSYARFDGEQMVVGVVLKDLNSYGPIYQSLQGGRR